MKRVTFKSSFFLFFVLTVSSLWGQSEPGSFYFPLNIGDYWEYTYSPAFLETREVMGDTLMPNGKQYRIVEQEVFGYTTHSFQRVSEDNELFQIDEFETEEYLRFRFDTEIDDSWNVPVGGGDSSTYVVTEIGDTTLWANEFKYIKIVAPEAFHLEFTIVDSLGIFHEGYEAAFLELNGAVINGRTFGMVTSVGSRDTNLSTTAPATFDNYPNPFNASTTFEYRLNKPAHVRLSIFNILGERVKTLYSGFQTARLHKIAWNADNDFGRAVSSGNYFYVFEVDGSIRKSGKILLMK